MKSFFKLPALLWVLFSLLVYGSVLVSPVMFKYSGIVSFAIPFVIILNFLILLFGLIFKSRVGWLGLLLIICGWPFINIGISIGGNGDLNEEGIKVLNYNVMRFNYPGVKNVEKELMGWINDMKPDIMCLQEFDARQANRDILTKVHNYHAFYGGYANSFAILSKYPILNGGSLYEDNSTNNIIFSDILVDSDTIRIYNVHLESMSINPKNIQTTDGIKKEYESVKNKFISASTDRGRQVSDLLTHLSKVKYPVLITGDFNDIPFSNNYFRLRRKFSNAFENKGRGLGATFNNVIPFLRIDNQFYSDKFELKSFKTFNNVYYSDHFPLVGIYELSH